MPKDQDMEESNTKQEKAFRKTRNELERLRAAIDYTETLTSMRSAELEQKYYLIWGMGIGLFFGIVGNVFASHWIEFLRGIVTNELWWITNVIGSFMALGGLLLFTVWTIRKMKKVQASVKLSQEIVQKMEELKESLEHLGDHSSLE